MNSGQKFAFIGSKSLNAVNVNGELLLCDSCTVLNAMNINSNIVFEINGSLMVGRNNDRKNITLNSNATFRLEASLVIYGDLIVNDVANLDFVGENSNVQISGNLRKAETAIAKVNFKDGTKKF